MYMVRYFALIGPRSQGHGRWWPDLSYEYLVALRKALPVRLISIGFVHFQTHDPKWKHWEAVRDCLQTPLTDKPLNVICCPAGIETGRKLRKKDLMPGDGHGIENPEAVVYEPGYALGHYWTKGLRNIAITGTAPKQPTDLEIEALKKYDAVVTPSAVDAEELRELGVDVAHYSPANLAADSLALQALLTGRGDE